MECLIALDKETGEMKCWFFEIDGIRVLFNLALYRVIPFALFGLIEILDAWHLYDYIPTHGQILI